MIETFHRLVRSAPLWASADLTHPTKHHDSTCQIEDGDCTCRTPVDQLVVGTRVVLLEERRGASLVSTAGSLPVWVESAALEATQEPVGGTYGSGSVPDDYLEWLGTGGQAPTRRVRAPPRGGGLVLVRSEKAEGVAWRWVGHVHEGSELCLLLVDPTVPLDQMLDVQPQQVRVVPLRGRTAANVLMPIGAQAGS